MSRSPARRKIDDSPTRGRLRVTVTTSSGFACSSVTSTVISFVMLAIGTRAGRSVRERPRPWPRSRRDRPRPPTGGGRREGERGSDERGDTASEGQPGASAREAYAIPTRIALADAERRRLDARVQREQRSTVGVPEARRDRAERVAAPDRVEAASGPASLRRAAPSARRPAWTFGAASDGCARRGRRGRAGRPPSRRRGTRRGAADGGTRAARRRVRSTSPRRPRPRASAARPLRPRPCASRHPSTRNA